MGTNERSQAVNFTLFSPAGSDRSSPSCLSPNENPSKGPLVAKVRPRLIESSQTPTLSGPAGTLAYTRLSPTGPRSDAKLAMASVPAAVGRRNPQLSSRYQTLAVDLCSAKPSTSM